MNGFENQNPLPQQFWYVYILKCSNERIYTGCTGDVEERIKRHNQGKPASTKENLPVEIMTYIAFTDRFRAFKFEKYLKSGFGRAFSKRHLQ